MTTTIAIALFDGAEELDWAGPWEVLSAWAHGWPDDDVGVFTIAATTDPVRCAKGLRVLPDYAIDEAPSFDVLLYPGGRGTRPQIRDEAIGAWLRELHAGGVLMTSVCTGSLVFAGAGLLNGLPAATYWSELPALESLGAIPRPDERFVDAGSIITAAGVSAGIDMALYLVQRLHSGDRARDVRRYIQYDPSPPI